MNSKERVRRAVNKQQPDRVPASFSGVRKVEEKLMKHFNTDDFDKVLDALQTDIRRVEPRYIGPELEEGEDFWGFRTKQVWVGDEYYSHVYYRPLDNCETIDDLKKIRWPSADWFDYDCIREQLDKYDGMAITTGWQGYFQNACNLLSQEKLFMDMALKPEFAHFIFQKMIEFQAEYYERTLEAGQGQIDIIRVCDDFGTQSNLMFSVDMWKEFFSDKLKKLVDVTHKHNAFFMQHSCGAIRELIPELINCGIDILDPIQKVAGMEPEGLKKDFGKALTFHGGIDTQHLLPFGTAKEVEAETRRFIDILHNGGGYILMASQGIQKDVSIENIEAMYRARF